MSIIVNKLISLCDHGHFHAARGEHDFLVEIDDTWSPTHTYIEVTEYGGRDHCGGSEYPSYATGEIHPSGVLIHAFVTSDSAKVCWIIELDTDG